MSRTSLISTRRRRVVCHRPAPDTRLLPTPFPDTVSPSHPPSGDGRPIDSTRHASSRGDSRGYTPFQGYTAPATRQGLWPDFVGSPEAIAPRVYSPVASLGTPLSHGDGKEVTPDPLRSVESVWGSNPLLDSPVFPLGESPSPRDGRGSALPSLRLVERFPHTDRHEVPSRPVPSRVWRRLAPPARAPWSRPFHRLPLPPHRHVPLNRHSGPPSSVIPAEAGIHPSRTTTYNPTHSPLPHPSFPPPIGNPWAGIPLALSGVEGSQERNGQVSLLSAGPLMLSLSKHVLSIVEGCQWTVAHLYQSVTSLPTRTPGHRKKLSPTPSGVIQSN